jgi:hypothetical protein
VRPASPIKVTAPEIVAESAIRTEAVNQESRRFLAPIPFLFSDLDPWHGGCIAGPHDPPLSHPEEVHVPVGLFRDGKKRKRRAAARARAAEAGHFSDDRRTRPDPLVTTATYVASPTPTDGEGEEYLSANPARGRY